MKGADPRVDVAEAVRRAHSLLERTELFDELGLATLAHDSRAVADDLIQIADQLLAERMARRATQDECGRWQQIAMRRGEPPADDADKVTFG
jgi:hypothetical protein